MFPSEDPDKVSGGGWDYHRRSTWRDWSFEGLDLERLKVGEWFFFRSFVVDGFIGLRIPRWS